MDIIYLLIPLSLIMVSLIIWVFVWSVKNRQFDDLESPAHRILMEDEVIDKVAPNPSKPPQKN